MKRNIIRALALGALVAGSLIPSLLSASTAWNSTRAGNPILPGYFADPCIRKFGDTYYAYVTPDGWDVGKGPYCIWTSKDFVNWTSHKSPSVEAGKFWPSTEFKWAPSVVEYKGKYYMYTQTPCMIWGAVGDTPLGPWKSLSESGKPMIPDQTPTGSIVLDGEAFIDDDGQIYLWYSTWWTPTVAKMKTDMCTIDGDPIQYFENGRNPGYKAPYGTVQGCMEAPYMFKRNGTYYLMYSNNFCQDHTYCVEYSTSKSPLGPFTYGKNNPILSTNDDDTVDGPGHHTILEDNGKVYIGYHRHDNPHASDGAHRQTAIDELHFLPDGSIEKVVPSHSGVGYLAPSTKRDTNLSLGKSANASSSAGPDFSPACAADENNGTLWKSSKYEYPQWLQVDLGKSQNVKRIETEFQFAQVGYSYVIEYSADGKTWQTFANRRDNKDWGPMIDKGDATGRYFKITLYGDDSPQRPNPEVGIWNLKIYDGIDKPNQAPQVDAGPDVKGTINFATRVVDGSVCDDGQPNGPVSVQWSKVSGPGDVTFEHPDRAYSKVTFSAPGEYKLQLTADDGKLKGSDTVTFNILPMGDELIRYKFDEAGGAVAQDSSINGQYGVMRIGAGRSLGLSGGAINLNGSNDYINVPSLGKCGNLTIAAWVNAHTINGDQCIISSAGTANLPLQASITKAGELCLTVNGKSQVSNFKFASDDLGSWKHVAIVYDGKSAAFYVNGKLDSSRPISDGAALDLSGGLKIGGSAPGLRGLDGELDDFCVYAKALSAGEIAQMAKPAKFMSIADVKKMAEGSSVRLMSKAVTFAPWNANATERTTDYFYVAERDGSQGIRVQATYSAQNNVREDGCVSFEGTLKTGKSGERYIELTSVPSAGAPCASKPLAPKGNQLAVLVKMKADVRRVADDGKSFTVASGGRETSVVVEKGIIVKKIAPGNTVEVTGVVSSEGADKGKSVLLLKEMARLNPPPAPGLAFYNFDETGGEIAKDSSTSDNNGRLVKSPKWVAGKNGGAINFDGTNWVEIPDMGLQKAVTVAAWINMKSFGPDDFGSSVMHCDGWDPGDLHLILSKADRNIVLAIGGSNPGDLRSKFKITDDQFGKWIHVAVTYDTKARNMALYVNGRLEDQKNLSQPCPIGFLGAKIGTWGGGSRMFDGMMDDFRIYDRALSADEIAALFNGK